MLIRKSALFKKKDYNSSPFSPQNFNIYDMANLHDSLRGRIDIKMREALQRSLAQLMHKLKRDHFSIDDFIVTQLPVTVQNLDPVFNGYRIVHFTDLHMGHWVSPDRLYGIIDLINQQQPNLVVNTGDYVSYVIDDYRDLMIAAFRNIKAPDGSLAVLGNHDHWMGHQTVRDILTAGNVTDISNNFFTVNRDNAKLHIAGIDDAIVGADRLNLVMEKLPEDAPALFLAHEPDFADKTAVTKRFFLQLSGHSHGTQILLPKLGPILRGTMFKKYPVGRYQIGDMVQYTSHGVGTHSFRVRINCPPEIVVVTLTSEQQETAKKQ